ncbi:hypothetical protein [Pseudomonas oryzihabitans]|uniref:DUF4123 domain-containing protein n=1 Tax=Pseudomonas oryzihabitans TaxID=47885 RepID=A0ABX3IMX9_9PSED|nr:hypothetical protein [Pseudomonas psychrotolerans]ONN69695.1 hypothetical protein BVL52_15560 [Pseudomonas psychrotolerans]
MIEYDGGSPVARDWTSTDLPLSDGPWLFGNAGIDCLRQQVEDAFARRQLDPAAEPLRVSADQLSVPATRNMQAYAALPASLTAEQRWHDYAAALEEGGRLVLDVRPAEHWQGFGRRLTAQDQRTPCYAVRDLISQLSAQGLAVIAIEPYAGLWDNAWLYRGLRHRHKWRRLLSWLANDEPLRTWALRLEQEVFATLAPRASGRCLVAAEKRPGAVDPEETLQQLAERDQALRDPLRLAPGAEVLAASQAEVTSSLRAQQLLLMLGEVLQRHYPQLDWLALLPESAARQLRDWQSAEAIDQRAMAILDAWHQGSGEHEELLRGLDYFLMTPLLRQYFPARRTPS